MKRIINVDANIGDVIGANREIDIGTSILQATCNALENATKHGDAIQIHLLKEVISHLEHAGAALQPKSTQERGMLPH
jgi:hypothetical protein